MHGKIGPIFKIGPIYTFDNRFNQRPIKTNPQKAYKIPIKNGGVTTAVSPNQNNVMLSGAVL